MIRTIVSLYSKILNVLLGLGTLIVVVLLTAAFSQIMPGFFAFILAIPVGFLLTAALLGAGFLILDMRNTLQEIATTLKQNAAASSRPAPSRPKTPTTPRPQKPSQE